MASLFQNKDEHFSSSNSFSISFQASKGEDPFLEIYLLKLIFCPF